MGYRDWQEAAREHLRAARSDGAHLRAALVELVGDLPDPDQPEIDSLDDSALEREIAVEEERNARLAELLEQAHSLHKREMTPVLLRWIQRMEYPAIPWSQWKIDWLRRRR
jgi:hypothetical protein